MSDFAGQQGRLRLLGTTGSTHIDDRVRRHPPKVVGRYIHNDILPGRSHAVALAPTAAVHVDKQAGELLVLFVALYQCGQDEWQDAQQDARSAQSHIRCRQRFAVFTAGKR